MTVFTCIFINKVNKNKDKPELKAKSTYFDNCMQKLFVVNDDLNKTNDTFDFQCYQKICNQILISVTHCSFLWWECDTRYITFPLFHSLVRVGLFRLASTSDIQITYWGLCQTSMVELFCEKNERLKAIKGTVMQIEKALISDPWPISKVSWEFRIPTIYNFEVIYT